VPMIGALALKLCSTPFGITEVGALRLVSDHGPHARCSTPFGITEVGARPARRGRCHLPCAQRLSASQRWAHSPSLDPLSPAAQCSTPFGITEVGATAQAFRPFAGPVLNAFRHHRGGRGLWSGASRGWLCVCSTPFGITEVGALAWSTTSARMKRAQRLSASQRWAQRTEVLAAAKNECAQRLSASQRWARAR